MLIEYPNGKRKQVKAAVGRALMRIKGVKEITEYENRSMADKPVVAKAVLNLDAMDKDELHALAKERGLQLHHNLGADKVRAALESQQ